MRLGTGRGTPTFYEQFPPLDAHALRDENPPFGAADTAPQIVAERRHLFYVPEGVASLYMYISTLVGKRQAEFWPVYQGRFKSFPVQEDDHYYRLCRYVARNPLRANLVERAEALRRSVQRGAPFGEASWQVATAAKLGLQSALRQVGRPKKDQGNPCGNVT